jgi:hypothetical protein
MQNSTSHRSPIASFSVLLLVLAACAGDGPKSAGEPKSDAPDHAPIKLADDSRWTDEFQSERVLTADEVTIEGPKGLLGHVFVTQDTENQTQETKATPEGLRIETRVKDGADDAPVRAQLDKWLVVAARQLVVLENPHAESVIVHARGDVFLSGKDAQQEVRMNELRMVGALRK